MRPLPALERRAGFTLVEVLLALFLLLIGMTSILGLLSFGAALTRTAELRSDTAHALEAVVADLEEGLFPLVLDESKNEVAGEPRVVEGRPVPGYPGLVYSARATPNPDPRAPRAETGAPLEYRVDVRVDWREGGRSRSRTFPVLLLREVSYGERLRRTLIEGQTPRPADSGPDETP